jgi:hypothetical protein
LETVLKDSSARVIDVFVDEVDLGELALVVTSPVMGRPSYNPGTLLKLTSTAI